MEHPLKKKARKVPVKAARKTVKKVVIDMNDQMLYAYADGSLVYSFGCVTGDSKHPTPKGKFKILRKKLIYRSKTYDSQMNYAMQLTTSGIYIHESYNYVEDPKYQTTLSTLISDTAAGAMSRMRSWLPEVAQMNVGVGINLTGSHGCIRLAHSDAVKLFDWADENIAVEIR